MFERWPDVFDIAEFRLSLLHIIVFIKKASAMTTDIEMERTDVSWSLCYYCTSFLKLFVDFITYTDVWLLLDIK